MKTTLIRTVLFMVGWMFAKFVLHWPEPVLIGLVTAYLLEGAVSQAIK